MRRVIGRVNFSINKVTDRMPVGIDMATKKEMWKRDDAAYAKQWDTFTPPSRKKVGIDQCIRDVKQQRGLL